MSESADFNKVDISILLSDRTVQQLLEIAEEHPDWPIKEMVYAHPKNTGGKQLLTYEQARIILKRLLLSTQTRRLLHQTKIKEYEEADKLYKKKLISRTIPDLISYIEHKNHSKTTYPLDKNKA